MEFLILGPLEVTDAGRTLALGGPKQRAVLAHLILRSNRVVQADLLIDGLWGEDPPESARNTLQTYVYRLRKLLGDGRIEGRDGGYVLTAAADEIDAERFESLMKRGKASVASDPAAAAAILSDALSLWRADALADVTEEPSLRGEAARLEELRLSATEHRIAAEIALGGHSTVVSELESLTARYPLRERMWAHLMLALYRSGRQAEALSTYERARQVLTEELGADPSPELQRLHEQILHGAPDLAAPEPKRARPPSVRPSRVDLQPGTEVAGYRIVGTLGRGGMSVVYLAEHDWLQRKVALKVLAPPLAEDERFRERFVRESRLAASLDHPNVIPIYEAVASGGDLFIAMRYVEGTDLRTLLHEGGALEPDRAVAIVRQVAAALDAAHEQGLVHRDVKPGNVLLARQRGSEAGEHVYLSDFGLTKRSASDSGITGTGQFVGTLDYAAPEQFKGDVADARTDVYSLGCVLFECLTGHPPFQSDNDAGLMYAHLQQRPPAVTRIAPGLLREIDYVVARAMAKAPGDRYQNAGVLADEASRALGLGVDVSGPDASRSKLRRLAVPVALAAALVAGVGVAALFRGEAPLAEAERSQTPIAAPRPTPEPNFPTVDRSLTENEQQLLSSIPEDVSAAGCRPLDRPEPIQGELASLVCRTSDVEVLYQWFPLRDLMNDAFQINLNNKRPPPGECATDHLAVTPYTIEDELAGRVLCYTIKKTFEQLGVVEAATSRSHLEWTDENGLIYAHAVRNDLGDLSLYEWWLTSAGPVVPSADGAAAVEKDRPSSVGGESLRDGSYLLALTEGEARSFASHQTLALRLDDGAYRFALDGNVVENGSTYLQKPNTIVFAPVTCPGQADPDALEPVVFDWSAKGDSVSWDKKRGGSCAGPQRVPSRPWTRAPAGLIAFETGGDIGLMDTGGFVVEKLTLQVETRPNIQPVWSPDGSRIAFAGAGDEGFDLYVMDADGSDLMQLTDTPGDEDQPAWSPDGTRIAFFFDDLGEPNFRSGVGIVGAEGGEWTALVTRDDEYAYRPAWSPDGTRIAFWNTTEGRQDLSVMEADGGNVIKLHRESTRVALGPISWTPDGKRLVFSGGAQGGEALLSMRTDGSDVRVLADELPDITFAWAPDWSADEDWIVMSDIRAVAVVYLMRADGSEVFLLSGGSEPRWRPDAD